MKGKYEYLKQEYPAKVSLEQLYKILGVSKRSAAYLVQHEIIPALDTGRRTWRYEIQISDVIHYLRRREQVGSMIPYGAVTSNFNRRREDRKNFVRLLETKGVGAVKRVFELSLKHCPDVMTTIQAAEACGLDPETIRRATAKGKIEKLLIGRNIYYPKTFLIDYMASPSCLNARSNSDRFCELLVKL